jgi:membrane fusion protein
MLATLVIVAVFVASASYARVETVGGAIVLDRGTAAIVASRPGIVTAVAVHDGEAVRAGTILARIRSEEEMAGGATMPQRVLQSLQAQDRRLSSQAGLLNVAAGAERARLLAQIAGFGDEIASLDTQIAAQRRLVEVAESDFNATRSIAERGFVSRRELDAREGALLARRQQLGQFEQARAAKSASLIEAQRTIAQSAASAEAQAAGVQSSRAELAGQLAQAELSRGYALAAPVDGTVTAITARIGQPAAQGQPMMVVMPRGARPRVELYVPSRSVGFLAIGQEVRLAVDAFPYQTFGTLRARIVQVATAAVPRQTADGGTIPVYLVVAELPQPWILAFGRQQPLLPGMSLSAHIVTERRSLLEWLFEPVFAVSRR